MEVETGCLKLFRGSALLKTFLRLRLEDLVVVDTTYLQLPFTTITLICPF